MKIVMTQAVCPEGMELLKGKASVYVADNGDPNKYLDEMKDADGILVRIAKLDRHAIENSPKLKVIGRTGVGCDSVDVEAATERGIPVVITPGANNRSVAEHTVAMMFALSKNLLEGDIETRKGNYKKVRDLHKVFELKGKTVGFLGLGAVGREAAAICKGIGMTTVGYDPYLTQQRIEELGCHYFKDYHEMLPFCDFISVHVPLTDSTRDMITAKELASMKKTAMVVNCARGGIINEADLIAALNNETIAGAGLDVTVQEPPTPDNPLFSAKNLIVSPHSAAQTREAVVNMAKMCVTGMLEVLSGKKCSYVFNPKAYDHGKWAEK